MEFLSLIMQTVKDYIDVILVLKICAKLIGFASLGFALLPLAGIMLLISEFLGALEDLVMNSWRS